SLSRCFRRVSLRRLPGHDHSGRAWIGARLRGGRRHRHRAQRLAGGVSGFSAADLWRGSCPLPAVFARRPRRDDKEEIMRSRWMGFVLVVVVLGAAPVAAEQGVTDTEVLLGGSNSFSGPLAFTGTQLTRFGVDLYFRVLNDAGGVHGRKIRTIYYDAADRPQDAVANTKKLVEH